MNSYHMSVLRHGAGRLLFRPHGRHKLLDQSPSASHQREPRLASGATKTTSQSPHTTLQGIKALAQSGRRAPLMPTVPKLMPLPKLQAQAQTQAAAAAAVGAVKTLGC